MTNLYFCLDCATIYDIPSDMEKVCPKCGRLLGLRQEERDRVATLAELASEAMSGPAPRVQPAWRVG